MLLWLKRELEQSKKIESKNRSKEGKGIYLANY